MKRPPMAPGRNGGGGGGEGEGTLTYHSHAYGVSRTSHHWTPTIQRPGFPPPASIVLHTNHKTNKRLAHIRALRVRFSTYFLNEQYRLVYFPLLRC